MYPYDSFDASKNDFEGAGQVSTSTGGYDPFTGLREAKIKKWYKNTILLFQGLATLKEESAKYRELVDAVIANYMVNLQPSGIFPEGYSHAYADGLRAGLSIFCFPEQYLRNVKEQMNNELGDAE